jgi:Asp-tRNA(Asn)/Glu-tRNA(Gln) amidotransferase A subunit family amidase
MKPSRREIVGAALLVSHPRKVQAAPTGDLTVLTLTEAATLLRKKAVSPVDLVRACLERIERLNPKLNAYMHRCGRTGAHTGTASGTRTVARAAARHPARYQRYL